MAATLAAFDNANTATLTLLNLQESPFNALLQPRSRVRLWAFSSSEEEVQRLKAALPGIKARQAERLLDNQEGGVRGALFGILVGVALTQLIGLVLYSLAQQPEAAGGINLVRSAGALVVLFTGFFGAILGGLLGYGLGQKWLGLPPDIARRYEHRLERGEVVIAVNQRRLLLNSPRRLRLRPGGQATFSLERLRFWLGEHGAHDTRWVRGSVSILKVTPSGYRKPLVSPFYYTGEPEDEDDSDIKSH